MKSVGKLKSMSTVEKSSASIGRKSPVTPISKPSTGTSSQQLTLCVEGSLVNRSVLPGSYEAQRMTVISGLKWCDALRQSGRLGSLARMCLGLSTWHSNKCVLIWKASAMKSGRLLFPLAPSMPSISGNEFGLLPTPVSSTGHYNQGGGNGREGQPRRYSLRGMAAKGLWPTPNVAGGGNPPHLLEENGNHFVRRSGKKAHLSLDQAVKMWPTPTQASNQMCPSMRERGSACRQMSDSGITHGSLNPQWVEWLMGYPIGWTDLKDSATPSSRRSRKR